MASPRWPAWQRAPCELLMDHEGGGRKPCFVGYRRVAPNCAMNDRMSDHIVPLPGQNVRRCLARTRAGASCIAPPLTDSRFCLFHDLRPEIVAVMDKARGKGLQRERVLAHAGEPLPVDLKDTSQLRAFERGVL